MTPRAMIFTEAGLPVPKRNDIRTWLHVDSMEQHGSLRMIKALRVENENLRDGIQAQKVANDELTEANANQAATIIEQQLEIEGLQIEINEQAQKITNQRIYILDLEKKIEVAHRLLDQAMARLTQP